MAATPQSDDGTVGTIARELERRIITGEYSAGQRLRQEALAAEFGVSRTPIREALRTLEAATFLQMVPRRGAIVRLPSPREIRDAYAVRAELEAKGVPVKEGSWGYRLLVVDDLDGNQLLFNYPITLT